MSRVIAIHWDPSAIHAVVIQHRMAHPQVEALLTVPLEGTQNEAEIGRQLAEALSPHSPGRAKILLAASRYALQWQHLDLPPSPAEDLPDLVRLQTDLDLSRSEEATSLDFLPLVGDHQTPHHVLSISLKPAEQVQLRNVCRAADLKPDRIVPLALGWPPLAKRAMSKGGQGLQVFLAPLAQQATIWATLGERVVLFRQVQLPEASNHAALEKAVASELRRTLFALTQQHADQETTLVSLMGAAQDDVVRLAQSLDGQAGLQVQPLSLESLSLDIPTDPSADQMLPLAGLALEEAEGHAPLIDLLHPRQRPAPRTSRRTYALATAAAVSLCALLGWRGYAQLQAPLEAAELAQAQLALLSDSLEEHGKQEQQAAALRKWTNGSANLLNELQRFSEKLRPTALDADPFPVDEDVVLEKLVLHGRVVVIGAVARKSTAVQLLENRLRDENHRIQRPMIEHDDAMADYPWRFRWNIELAEEGSRASEDRRP